MRDLLKLGVNYRPLVLGGEWWRLLSSMFLHGGLVHLVSNIGAFFLIGILVEPILGKYKLLFIYFITGICASLTSILFHEATISVGASGAIMGLYGFL